MTALFGLTADAAELASRPPGWDYIERKAPAVQVAAFESEGWDVTDDKRRPLRVLAYFSAPLWLAIRGVAVPFAPESNKPEAWAAKMEADRAEPVRVARARPVGALIGLAPGDDPIEFAKAVILVDEALPLESGVVVEPLCPS